MIYVVKHKEDRRTYPEGYEALKVGKIFEHPEDDNIEYLNPYINELTGLYYIWKNKKDKIVGLCHYRRFFAEGTDILSWDVATELAKEYDIVTSEWYTFGKPLRENLIDHFPGQRDVFMKYYDIICDKDPGIAAYYEQEVFNPTNMFIAKREVMEEYCKWIFPLIMPMAERFRDEDAGKCQEPLYHRMIGFMAERLLRYYIKNVGKLNYKEWPIIFKEVTDA